MKMVTVKPAMAVNWYAGMIGIVGFLSTAYLAYKLPKEAEVDVSKIALAFVPALAGCMIGAYLIEQGAKL